MAPFDPLTQHDIFEPSPPSHPELDRVDLLLYKAKSLMDGDDGDDDDGDDDDDNKDLALLDSARERQIQSVRGDSRPAELTANRTLPPTAKALPPIRGSSLHARRRTLPPTPPPPEDAVEEITKAVLLALVDFLPELLQSHIQELESFKNDVQDAAILRCGEVVSAKLREMYADLRHEMLQELKTDLETYFRDGLEEIQQRIEKLHTEVDRKIEINNQQTEALVTRLATSIPAPTVNVSAPEVNVPPATVKVQLPTRTITTEKRIAYSDLTGRPETIHETITDSPNGFEEQE